jgi:hypothetical protein
VGRAAAVSRLAGGAAAGARLRIAVLDGGRIAELGSHAELLAAGGMYARMFALQAEWFREAGRRGGSRPAERSGERGR